MVSLGGLFRTVSTTSNFGAAIFLKVSGRRTLIVFRNGIREELNWKEYCKTRDWFDKLNKKSFKIEKIVDRYNVKRKEDNFGYFSNSFVGARNFFEFIMQLESDNCTLVFINESELSIKKYNASFTIRKLEDNLLEMMSKNVIMTGPIDSISFFFFESKYYECNCKDKTVLDVGGYCGETAVFFSNQGAKRVIIYEPVLSHHRLIEKNIEVNNVEAELHAEGLGTADGTTQIHYENTNVDFGRSNFGINEISVKLKNATKLIIESKADIGKFDCEGAEECLTEVPNEILRKINYYIIETHTPKIRKAIIEKFAEAGFKMNQQPRDLTSEVSILYFDKSEASIKID